MPDCSCGYTGLGLPCEHQDHRGRPAMEPCPSEAAYRRELRAHAADPEGTPPPHAECRRAGSRANYDRWARRQIGGAAPSAADAVRVIWLWPCLCPRALPTLEQTLIYAHGYGYAAEVAAWIHE